LDVPAWQFRDSREIGFGSQPVRFPIGSKQSSAPSLRATRSNPIGGAWRSFARNDSGWQRVNLIESTIVLHCRQNLGCMVSASGRSNSIIREYAEPARAFGHRCSGDSFAGEAADDHRGKRRLQTDSGIGTMRFLARDDVFQPDSLRVPMKIMTLNFRVHGVIRVMPC
jgi:hypothetical protein